MEFQVASEVVAALKAEADSEHPRECCGILVGEKSRITAIRPARNVHPDPLTHFEIDPQTLIDAFRSSRSGSSQVLGYYHSHPNGRASPSRTDRAQAAHDDKVWAIIAGDAISFWIDKPNGFVPLSYKMVNG